MRPVQFSPRRRISNFYGIFNAWEMLLCIQPRKKLNFHDMYYLVLCIVEKTASK